MRMKRIMTMTGMTRMTRTTGMTGTMRMMQTTRTEQQGLGAGHDSLATF